MEVSGLGGMGPQGFKGLELQGTSRGPVCFIYVRLGPYLQEGIVGYIEVGLCKLSFWICGSEPLMLGSS